jgi:hypothetical protein
VIISTRAPVALARRIMSGSLGWDNGSPNPPKNTEGATGQPANASMMREKTRSLMFPVGSFHVLRMQVLHASGQSLVGST